MIAHEVVGRGEPLLMIMGLSGTRKAWWRLLPHLRERAECIVFDNRGTGDSAPVRAPLSMRDLVDDALSALDAAGHASAHVLGVSMGGMIAQHLALDHRARVRSLVLGCTTPVGRAGLPPWRLLAATALRPVLGFERTAPLLAPALYGERTRRERPDRLREDLRMRLDESVSAVTSLAQMGAIAGHSTRSRLGELAGLDVTVVHGTDDALVPFARGAELARDIPGARLVAIPGAGHMLTTDAEEETVAAIVEHLERADPRGA